MQQAIGKYRWTICGLLFFATTINYIDRSVISFLKVTFTDIFRWNDADYANVELAFKISYAAGLLMAGRFIDKVGTKAGYAISLVVWSLASIGHALVRTVVGFITARSVLGVSEAGNFPAAIKTVAEWFPKKERAFATGIFNSGANIGAVAAPLTVPFIVKAWGWQWAFIITGTFGLVWLIFWFIYYEVPQKQRRLKQPEFDYIHSDIDEKNDTREQRPRLSWPTLLGYRQTWAFSIGKFLTDPVWWFYLFWLPDFLDSQYGITGTGVVLPVALVYTLSTIGSIGGGWLPLYMIRRGTPTFRARKTSMLIYAVMVTPIIFAQILGNTSMWFAIIIIGIAAAAHQAWSANIFTTVSDMFPKNSTASVTGIGGMFGALGGILLTWLVQKSLFVHFRSIGKIETAYYIMFILCGTAYIAAWLIMHFLVPRMKRVEG